MYSTDPPATRWCGVVWCGVVWCGVVWCGVVWCGVVWCGVVWCGVVWCGGLLILHYREQHDRIFGGSRLIHLIHSSS